MYIYIYVYTYTYIYIHIHIYIYVYFPTSTKPVVLKILYNMVCRLRWSALGKKLRLCSVTDILRYRYVVSSGSLVIVVIRLPRSS